MNRLPLGILNAKCLPRLTSTSAAFIAVRSPIKGDVMLNDSPNEV